MGVRESTHLLLHHPVFQLGAPTYFWTRQSTVHPAISPGSHNGYRVQPGRPAGIRTRIASFGGMCPVQLSDRPKMVRAEGLEPSRLCVRSAVSCPVERRPHNKMAAGDGIEPPLLGSEPSVLPLNEPAMAGSERIERPQLASKTSGLPLTELPIGVTGGIRTHVGLVHSQPPET